MQKYTRAFYNKSSALPVAETTRKFLICHHEPYGMHKIFRCHTNPRDGFSYADSVCENRKTKHTLYLP